MTEGENKAIEYLKENSLVRLNENNEIVAYGNAYKYYIINYIEKLQKENEELKEKVFKRDKELIRLEEYANKNFVRKDDVKAKYIPKDKIRETIKELEELKKQQKNCFDIDEFLNLDAQTNLLKKLLEEE